MRHPVREITSMFGPLKPATIDDRKLLLALIAEYYSYDEIVFDESSISEGLDLLLTEPQFGCAFLIEKDHVVAGYLIFTFGFDLEVGGPLGLITDIYFRPEFRRQGLGSSAMNSLFEIATDLGLKAIQLQPERDNAEARAFYEYLGFRSFDRIPLSKALI
jgi:ribosomal protein S18 acetylase RimI-like enzyme